MSEGHDQIINSIFDRFKSTREPIELSSDEAKHIRFEAVKQASQAHSPNRKQRRQLKFHKN